MGVKELVGLYDAMREIEKLKDDIMEISARLKKLQNKELNNIIKKIDEEISSEYWFADAHTKMMEVYMLAPPEGQISMRQLFPMVKNLLKDDPEKFRKRLEKKIHKLETYIEANKTTIGEQYIAEIRNYITLLRKLDAANARFVAELIKNLDHAMSIDPTKSNPIKGFGHTHNMYN